MPRLDPEFSGKAPETMRFHSRGDLPMPSRDEPVLARAREQVQAQVSATPTPITHTLGKGTPKEADFHEKVKEVARKYGIPVSTVRAYIEKEALPYMSGPPPSWENGTGQKFLSALRRFEQQVNFSSQTGKTPNEAVEATYAEQKSMKSRESEVASALGIPNYDANQKRREYLATAQERRDNVMKIVSDPYQKAVLLQKIDEELEELKRLRAEDRRGGKKRKTRTSKKSARKTRRRA
jgi:hypothetical protein